MNKQTETLLWRHWELSFWNFGKAQPKRKQMQSSLLNVEGFCFRFFSWPLVAYYLEILCFMVTFWAFFIGLWRLKAEHIC